MLAKAREKAKILNKQVELIQMDAQNMDFAEVDATNLTGDIVKKIIINNEK